MRTTISALLLCAAAGPLLVDHISQAAPADRPKLPPVSSEILRAADALGGAGWRYMYTHERGAHTNGAVVCGKTVAQALAAWQGNEEADAPLLRQIRFNLLGDRCLVAAGGYGSQHERAFTASCALIRQTPRVWDQLTEDEQRRMDLLMRAALVASAYTTSDTGHAGGQNTDLMGGKNLNRNWNPNFREGMIGMMIVGTIWLGGAEEAYAFLDGYDHRAFTAQLRGAGLDNTARTFAWHTENPESGAPSPQAIERDIRGYRYMETRLDDLMTIYTLLTRRTYGATVSAGLNNGAGKDGGGRLAAGAENLPNVGRPGMLHELASGDASGPRSGIGYAYDGFRPNLMNQLVMLTSGYWKPGEQADECLALMRVGIPDLFYKLDHGYINFQHGRAAAKPQRFDPERHDHRIMRSLWEDLVAPYHAGP